jgi:integrase/recombinase XerC
MQAQPMPISHEVARWVDYGVSPPQCLPQDSSAAALYLTEALGHPVFETWTWQRLVKAYGTLPDAKRSKPKVCRLLIEVTQVTEVWHQGKLQSVASEQAPDVARVVLSLLKSYKKRFRHVSTGQVLVVDEQASTPVEPIVAPGLVNWLQRTGRLYNIHPQTNTLGVEDDYAAISMFLRERAARSKHTRRAYLTELEGLVRWCMGHGLGPLSDLTRVDLQRYQAHMRAPQDGGIAKRDTSQTRAFAVVASLFRYWHSTGYLLGNPAVGLTTGTRAQAGFTPKRFVPINLLQHCDTWVAQSVAVSPDLPRWRRAAIWTLFRFSGARLAELAWNTEVKLPHLEIDSHGNTVLTVMGKGGKERYIPLPAMGNAVLAGYRQARGLSPLLHGHPEQVPLIHGDKGGALGARGLYDEIRMVLQSVASAIEDTDPAGAALLREVSPHWLRHAYARTLVVDKRVPLPAAQALLGHASVQTTAAYAKTDLRQLRVFVELGFCSTVSK